MHQVLHTQGYWISTIGDLFASKPNRYPQSVCHPSIWSLEVWKNPQCCMPTNYKVFVYLLTYCPQTQKFYFQQSNIFGAWNRAMSLADVSKKNLSPTYSGSCSELTMGIDLVWICSVLLYQWSLIVIKIFTYMAGKSINQMVFGSKKTMDTWTGTKKSALKRFRKKGRLFLPSLSSLTWHPLENLLVVWYGYCFLFAFDFT